MSGKPSTLQCSSGHVRTRADLRVEDADVRSRRHQRWYCVKCGEECDRRPPQMLREALDLDDLGVYTRSQYEAFLDRLEAADEAARLGIAVEDLLTGRALVAEQAEAEIQAKIDLDMSVPPRLSTAEVLGLIEDAPTGDVERYSVLFEDPW